MPPKLPEMPEIPKTSEVSNIPDHPQPKKTPKWIIAIPIIAAILIQLGMIGIWAYRQITKTEQIEMDVPDLVLEESEDDFFKIEEDIDDANQGNMTANEMLDILNENFEGQGTWEIYSQDADQIVYSFKLEGNLEEAFIGLMSEIIEEGYLNSYDQAAYDDLKEEMCDLSEIMSESSGKTVGLVILNPKNTENSLVSFMDGEVINDFTEDE